MISYRDCDDLVNRALLTEYYGENFYSDAPKVKIADGRSMHPSGYLYEGYENAFYDTFISDRTDAFLASFAIIAARDGKELSTRKPRTQGIVPQNTRSSRGRRTRS